MSVPSIAWDRLWHLLRRRPYIIPLVIVACFLLSMWALNRERALELSDIPPAVLAAVPDGVCGAGPRFSTLKLTFKRELREDGIPVEVKIERIEKALGRAIALRREKWFHKNELSPVLEQRGFIICGLLALDYHERGQLPLFGDLLREVGWNKERITDLKVRELKGFPNVRGGVFEFTKTTSTSLNVDTGLEENVVKPTRCEVVARINADHVHPKFAGDGYQVNCSSELDIRTSGGIPAKEKTEKVKKISVYYFIEQLGWLYQVRDQVGELRTDTTLVDFSVE